MILLRSFLFNAVMFGSGFVLSLYGNLLLVLAPPRLPALARVWARFVLATLKSLCGVELCVDGSGTLDAKHGVIIAPQHQSAMDVMIWLSLLEAPVFVVKQELLKIPVFGRLLKPAGMIAVDRAGGAGALRLMVQECQSAVAAGRMILIFPEGTRVAPGAEVPLQPGIVALAKALNVPVIPAATNSGLHWARKAFRKTPGTVRLRLFPPLSPALPRAAILDELRRCFYEAKLD